MTQYYNIRPCDCFLIINQKRNFWNGQSLPPFSTYHLNLFHLTLLLWLPLRHPSARLPTPEVPFDMSSPFLNLELPTPSKSGSRYLCLQLSYLPLNGFFLVVLLPGPLFHRTPPSLWRLFSSTRDAYSYTLFPGIFVIQTPLRSLKLIYNCITLEKNFRLTVDKLTQFIRLVKCTRPFFNNKKKKRKGPWS